MPEPAAVRSYLYAPGGRPELLATAYASGADAVVCDLEDAVPPDRQPAARAAAADRLLVMEDGRLTASGATSATAAPLADLAGSEAS